MHLVGAIRIYVAEQEQAWEITPVLNKLINLVDELLEACQTGVYPVQISINVHGVPRQQRDAWLNLEVQVVQVCSEQWLDHRHDLGHHTIVLLQDKRELAVIQSELLLLEQDHLGAFRDLAIDALKAFSLPDELQDLRQGSTSGERKLAVMMLLHS